MSTEEEKIGTLVAMFGEQGWDEASLSAILAESKGDVEVAVDTVLAAGSSSAWAAQRVAASSEEERSIEVALPREAAVPQSSNGISVVVPPGTGPGGTLQISHAGRSFVVTVPAGVQPGGRFIATLPNADTPEVSSRRGRQVDLPDDFLRLPQQMTDEQLAMAIQHEDYLAADRAAALQARQREQSRGGSRNRQPQQQQRTTAGGAANSTSMFDSVRAGFSSAAKNLQAYKTKLTSKSQTNDDPPPPPEYGRLDLSEELQDDENPLHVASAPAPASSRNDLGTQDHMTL